MQENVQVHKAKEKERRLESGKLSDDEAIIRLDGHAWERDRMMMHNDDDAGGWFKR